MNLRTAQLLKLHKLYSPADENGSDAGGTEVELAEEVEQGGDSSEPESEEETEPEEEPEVVVTIGEEQEQEEEEAKAAPSWVKDLRKSNREKDRVIRQLQSQLQSKEQPQTVILGPKPTLEGCEYDGDKFAEELEQWHLRKIEVDKQEKERKDREEKTKAQWQSRLDTYNRDKTELKVLDFDEAEEVVQSTLSVVQQGIIVSGAKNSAVLMYALGKNPKKAKELASISDPVQFAWAAAQLEKDLKVSPRKAPPMPERTVKGSVSAAASIASNTQLEALKKKAQETGNYEEYFAAKRKAGK